MMQIKHTLPRNQRRWSQRGVIILNERCGIGVTGEVTTEVQTIFLVANVFDYRYRNPGWTAP
jgi:hypothetical protein